MNKSSRQTRHPSCSLVHVVVGSIVCPRVAHRRYLLVLALLQFRSISRCADLDTVLLRGNDNC